MATPNRPQPQPHREPPAFSSGGVETGSRSPDTPQSFGEEVRERFSLSSITETVRDAFTEEVDGQRRVSLGKIMDTLRISSIPALGTVLMRVVNEEIRLGEVFSALIRRDFSALRKEVHGEDIDAEEEEAERLTITKQQEKIRNLNTKSELTQRVFDEATIPHSPDEGLSPANLSGIEVRGEIAVPNGVLIRLGSNFEFKGTENHRAFFDGLVAYESEEAVSTVRVDISDSPEEPEVGEEEEDADAEAPAPSNAEVTAKISSGGFIRGPLTIPTGVKLKGQMLIYKKES